MIRFLVTNPTRAASPPFDGAERLCDVISYVGRESTTVYPNQFAALVRFANDRLAVPVVHCEEQVQVLQVVSVLGCRVQQQCQSAVARCRLNGDLFPQLTQQSRHSVLTAVQMPGWQAQLPVAEVRAGTTQHEDPLLIPENGVNGGSKTEAIGRHG